MVWFSTLKKTINEEELAQQKFYNESLHSTLFELRRFKHDWSNNMTVIYSMLKMDKINELKEYISELIVHNSEQVSTEIYNIKNAGLFGIISSKISQARDAGVKIELSVIGEIENIPGIKISELCEIVGILIDNAIDEAVKTKKTVDILVRKSELYIEISISNSCAEAPDLQLIFEDGYSTKGDNRGMGLAIAKKILDKYKNILHIASYEENVFTQTIEIRDGKG
jgi:two-component system sensor histidine kinase AgrC